MSAPPGRKEFRALSKFALLATTVWFFSKKDCFRFISEVFIYSQQLTFGQ